MDKSLLGSMWIRAGSTLDSNCKQYRRAVEYDKTVTLPNLECEVEYDVLPVLRVGVEGL